MEELIFKELPQEVLIESINKLNARIISLESKVQGLLSREDY